MSPLTVEGDKYNKDQMKRGVFIYKCGESHIVMPDGKVKNVVIGALLFCAGCETCYRKVFFRRRVTARWQIAEALVVTLFVICERKELDKI